MKRILSSLVDAAAPFLEAQLASTHFEYMGVDFMIDEVGGARGEMGQGGEWGKGGNRGDEGQWVRETKSIQP